MLKKVITLLSFFLSLQMLAAEEVYEYTSNSRISAIVNALSAFASKEKSFEFIDLELSEEALVLLDQLKINFTAPNLAFGNRIGYARIGDSY